MSCPFPVKSMSHLVVLVFQDENFTLPGVRVALGMSIVTLDRIGWDVEP